MEQWCLFIVMVTIYNHFSFDSDNSSSDQVQACSSYSCLFKAKMEEPPVIYEEIAQQDSLNRTSPTIDVGENISYQCECLCETFKVNITVFL